MTAYVTFGFMIVGEPVLSIKEMADHVGRAMGCRFRGDELHGVPGWLTSLLGMEIFLYHHQRKGAGYEKFHLIGNVGKLLLLREDDPDEMDDYEWMNLSQGIADLLVISGVPGDWHVPSDAEVEASISLPGKDEGSG